MLRALASSIIRYYQRYFRHLLGQNCRFSPSCSEYALQALGKYGFIKGGFKGLRRLCTCHPFSSKAGHDPLT